MIVCVPVDSEGLVDPRWGRAARVVLATMEGETITDWQELAVGWDVLHDAGGEGAHHARVAHFVRDHAVDAVVAHHMGEGMSRMLERMGVRVQLGAGGDARQAVRLAVPSS